jgi:catechol 2,3-dioxygenase-like lactoylglutathione lyase family enzyme
MIVKPFKPAICAALVPLLLNGCGLRSGDSGSNDARQPHQHTASTVVRVGYSARDLESTVGFFRDVLDFELLEEASVDELPVAPGVMEIREARVARLRLGEEQIEITQYSPAGHPIPEDSASNDLWFQHLAIVVSDMDRAHERLVEHGVSAVSEGGPQTIPAWNAAAGGIRAFYFTDPERHVLEIIWYPPGKGSARWQEKGRLFLGIDHTAIAVSSTDKSLAFYEDVLGFVKVGESLNYGPEQEALSGVDGARVRITGLVGHGGMGIELLHYLEPDRGRPASPDTRLQDAWHWEITLETSNPNALIDRASAARALWSTGVSHFLQDPDNHVLRVILARSQL